MIELFTSFLLGLLTILDPCTLFTSITAIAFIDREIGNHRRVLLLGSMFVLGKLLTYMLLSLPLLAGGQNTAIQEALEHFGEPITAAFMIICGIVLLFSGHLHHDHDHGISKWLNQVDEKNTPFWAFMLGIFFAIAFCPHRLVYFVTMIDIALGIPAPWNLCMPFVFGLGTGLPILIIAWLISYSLVKSDKLRVNLTSFQKWFRYICAALFIAVGFYLVFHSFHHHDIIS